MHRNVLPSVPNQRPRPSATHCICCDSCFSAGFATDRRGSGAPPVSTFLRPVGLSTYRPACFCRSNLARICPSRPAPALTMRPPRRAPRRGFAGRSFHPVASGNAARENCSGVHPSSPKLATISSSSVVRFRPIMTTPANSFSRMCFGTELRLFPVPFLDCFAIGGAIRRRTETHPNSVENQSFGSNT